MDPGSPSADRPVSAPAPLQAAAPLLNDEHLRSFMDLDPSGDFIAGVVATFTANSTQALADLRRAVADGNVAAAASVAHQLKGTSSTLGVLEMHRVCVQLDQLTSAGQLDATGPLIDQCEREFRRGLAALEQFLAAHRARN